jgi:phosphotransferase system enzyme I (PtsI)
VGLSGATQLIAPGQMIALDGSTGEVVLEPSEDALERWRQRAELATVALRRLDELRSRPAATADGIRIRLEANLEIADEVGRVRDSGAEGIGLYRSEFLIDAARPEAASEQAQLETYRSLLEAMRPLPVTVRTFDAGEDRWGSLASRGAGTASVSVCAVRAALQHDERFRLQIQGACAPPRGRAAHPAAVRHTGEELRQVRILIGEIAHEMGLEMQVPIGAMIEWCPRPP